VLGTLVLALLLNNVHAAGTKYVSDQFKITMRSGMATDHKIIRMLPSGHRLEVLDEDKDKGYTKVRSEDGKVGYVLTRYLMSEPSARQQLSDAQNRLEELQQAPDQLAAELDRLQTSHAKLTEEHKVVSTEKSNLEQELADFRKAYAEPVKVARERDQLRQQLAGLIRQNEELKQEKRELENSSDRMWFMLGGGAIIIGIILGLILPHLRTTRRSSSWSSL
jgi:SH3 domain protein